MNQAEEIVILQPMPALLAAGGQGYRICPAQGSCPLVDNAYQLLETPEQAKHKAFLSSTA